MKVGKQPNWRKEMVNTRHRSENSQEESILPSESFRKKEHVSYVRFVLNSK